MSSTQLSGDDPAEASRATPSPMRLEVVIIPVADVDRAKTFYHGLGWRLDADAGGGDFRVVQLTPPGSTASIIFGNGVSSADPGSVDRLLLAVDDIKAAIDELRSHGVEVSDAFHDGGGSLAAGFFADAAAHAPGPDPEGRSYASYASFSDPDGNRWLLQEITDRLPGRVEPLDVPVLAQLLQETAEHHDPYEKAAPPHDWFDWYAAYFAARQAGSGQDEASAVAGRYMAEVKHVVVPSGAAG
jgi:catechol 2,3-dioxygenase-like lactoylglutathione lyase family enzyme